MSVKRFFSIKKIIFILLIISWIVGAACFGDFINHTEFGAMIFVGIFMGICYIAISSLIKRLKYLTDKLKDYCEKFNYGYTNAPKFDIIPATLGNDAGILGAAALVL